MWSLSHDAKELGTRIGSLLVNTTLAIAVAFFFTISGRLANAQLSTAQLSGSVHDPSAALIPGAEVTATETATGVKATTTANERGLFVFPTLPVGPYTISVSASGFAPYRQTGLVLTVGQQLNLDVVLAVGATDQTVTVTANSVALDNTTPVVQTSVDQQTVQNLPLNGRNPADLLKTVAGVTDTALNQSTTNPVSSVSPSDATIPASSAPVVHGSRPGGVYFSLDGATNTDPYTVIGGPFPNPDATGEFTVVTGTYGAHYVSAPGGAVNIVSRSGANQLHGSAFEFVRNGFFNARNALSTEPDVLKRHQFGATMGGPIVANKLFAFGAYQATLQNNNVTHVSYFPTAAMRAGNFGTFQIPTAMLDCNPNKPDSTTCRILDLLPTPSDPFGRFSFQVPTRENWQEALLKLDLALSNHRLFARGFYNRYDQAAQAPNQNALAAAMHQGYVMPWLSTAVGDTWTKGQWIFDTRASFLEAETAQRLASDALSYKNLNINNLSGQGIALIYGGFTVNTGSQTYFPRRSFELSENAYLVKGKHQLSFGADYTRVSLNETNYAGQNPVDIYAGVNTYIFGLYGLIPNGTINALSDLMLGMPYIFGQSDGYYIHTTGNLFGTYAEDTYRATSKLTVTAGLRWDPFLPYAISGQRMSCFISGQQSKVYPNALPGLLFHGDSGCPENGVQSKLSQFQPRAGVAYQLSNKTVVRSGYGLYALQFPMKAFEGFTNAQPWVRNYSLEQAGLSIDNIWGSAGIASDPFAGGFHYGNYQPSKDVSFSAGLPVASIGGDFRPAYEEQWSLSVQQMLTAQDSLELAYLGTAAHHLSLGTDLNTAVYVPGMCDTPYGPQPCSSAQNIQQRRPDQNFANVGSLRSIGNSAFNGLDVTFRHVSKSFTLASAFGWAKSLDDVSAPGTASSIQIPNGDHKFRRGRSDFDQNIVSRTTGTWTSPAFSNLNTVARTVAGSWIFSGIVTLDSGLPFSVTDGTDPSETGFGSLAKRVSGTPSYVNGRLNYAAFTNADPGTYGPNLRNDFRGPSKYDVDMAMMKEFPIYERTKLMFRAEAFNLFNHPNYYPPTSAYSTATDTAAQAAFGLPTGAMDPRILQFSLKATF